MQKGFSTLEVTLFMAVAGVLIYAASASWLSLAPKYRLKKAAWEIHTRLNYARNRAIFDGGQVRVKFDTNGYTVERYDDLSKGWRRILAGRLEGIQVEANNSPTFHPFGTVSNLATIIVSNSWGRYRITLAISGRIRVAEM